MEIIKYLKTEMIMKVLHINLAGYRASQVAPVLENLPANAGNTREVSLIPGWEDPLGKKVATTPVFLPGKFHGQKSLTGYSLWGHKESDLTEQIFGKTIALNAILTKKKD